MKTSLQIVLGYALSDQNCADRVRWDLTERNFPPGPARLVFNAISRIRTEITPDTVALELVNSGIRRLNGRSAQVFLYQLRMSGDYETFKRAVRLLQNAPPWTIETGPPSSVAREKECAA